MEIVWQPEDNLREKKVESDLKDLLKTMVAFANSVAPGDTAKIFIGERNDGTVQGVTNADNIQKTIVKEADKIYPEIYYRTEVYERDGKQCVRIDIKHNGLASPSNVTLNEVKSYALQLPKLQKCAFEAQDAGYKDVAFRIQVAISRLQSVSQLAEYNGFVKSVQSLSADRPVAVQVGPRHCTATVQDWGFQKTVQWNCF